MITSLCDLEEDDRENLLATIRNIGLDGMFIHGNVKETDPVSSIAYAAWEMLADGMGEDDGLQCLIDEYNNIVSGESDGVS